MKRITKIKTFDGKEHEDGVAAFKHLERLYSDELGRIARAVIAQDGKYVKTASWIDEHLCDFMHLHRIKGDMAMEQENDDE